MPSHWSISVIDDLRASIESGRKTTELRIPTSANQRLIGEMLRYRPGDQLTIQFRHYGNVVGSVVATITEQTRNKLLGELTDAEVCSIVGLLPLDRTGLIAQLRRLYGRTLEIIDENTPCYLAHFETH